MFYTDDHLIIFCLGMDNFNRSGYLGTWYEESNMFEVYQIASSCVRATYTHEGDRVGVFNEGLTAVWVVNVWLVKLLDFILMSQAWIHEYKGQCEASKQ